MEEGFSQSDLACIALTFMNTDAHMHSSFREHFMPDGNIPPIGSIARAPTLGRTLHAIAEYGPEVFYQGSVAEYIEAFFGSERGLITMEDLAAYQNE